jgi:ketosteroid isomerase-like protein
VACPPFPLIAFAPPRSRQEAARAIYEDFNRRDLDGLVERLARDVTWTDHAVGVTYEGREGVRAMLEGWIEAMPDGQATELTFLESPDAVVVQHVGCGTRVVHLGPLTRSPERVQFPVCDILRFNSEGLVERGESYYDLRSIVA